MRIASLTPELLINSIYRSLVPMQALAHRGHAVHVEERNELRDPRMLLECDVVQILRLCHPQMQRLARQLREAGVALVWDVDGDVAAVPRESPAYSWVNSMRGQRMFAGMATMMRSAALVTTPSPLLAERFREADGVDARVLENRLPPTFVRPERVMPHPGVTVGWFAAVEHEIDFDQLGLRETIEQLMARHPHLEFATIGIDVGVRRRKYNAYGTRPYGELPQDLVHFDIGIAPLLDIPYNRARSNVKLKEYAAVGVPWLASPVGPYRGLGEEHGGRLVPDGRWYQELEQLVVEPELRSRLAHRGRRWAQEELIEAHVEEWERTFEDAAERARAGRAVRR